MRLLPFADVIRTTGRSRSTIYRDVERGFLPRPIKIGERLYWEEAELRISILRHRTGPVVLTGDQPQE